MIQTCANQNCGHVWQHPTAIACPQCGSVGTVSRLAPDVVLNTEGGMRYNGNGSNPYVPPSQSPLFSWVQVSVAAEDWGNRFADMATAVRASPANQFSGLDRGSLLRIARATERTVKAVESLARSVRESNKATKEMVKFLKELQAEYKQRKKDEGEREEPE